MQTLSETLTNHQKTKGPWQPHVELYVDDRHVGVPRLRWTSKYSGAEDARHTAIAACANYVVRAYIDASGNVQVARAAYDSASYWGTWTQVATGASTTAQLALVSDGGVNCWLFYLASDDRTIYVRASGDAGITFGSATQVAQIAASHKCTSLAGAYAYTGPFKLTIVYSDSDEVSGPDDSIWTAYSNNGTSWTTAEWGRSSGDHAQGLALHYETGTATYQDLYFFLCGQFEDTNFYSVRMYYVQIPNAGAPTWAFVGTPLIADNTTWNWKWPAIARCPADAEHPEDRARVFVVEDDGTDHRLTWFFVHDLITTFPHTFSDPVPFNYTNNTFECGLALCVVTTTATGHPDRYFLANAPKVWYALVYEPSTAQQADVSADLVAYSYRMAHRSPTTSIFILRNDDNRYDNLGVSGPYEAIKRGSQVSLREGYKTAAGNEVAYQPPVWIESIIRIAQPTRLPIATTSHNITRHFGQFVALICYDAWTILHRTPATRSYSWHTSPQAVLKEAFGKFGFYYSDDDSPSLAVSGTAPVFSLNAGTSWATLIKKVLDYCGCEVKFYVEASEEATWPSARAHVFTPADDSTYIYGFGTVSVEHLIYSGSYADNDQRAGHFQVYGDGDTFAQDFDFDEIDDLGFCFTQKIHDPRYTGVEEVKVADRAGYNKKRAQWGRYGGQIVVPNNVGQELLDVVTITDTRVGLAAVTRRITSIRKDYDTRRPRPIYEAYLTLGLKPPAPAFSAYMWWAEQLNDIADTIPQEPIEPSLPPEEAPGPAPSGAIVFY